MTTTIEDTLAEAEGMLRGARTYAQAMDLCVRNLEQMVTSYRRRCDGLTLAIHEAEQLQDQMARMGEVSGWLPDGHRAEIEARLLSLKGEILKTFAQGDF